MNTPPGYTTIEPIERNTSMHKHELDLGNNLTGLLYLWTIIMIVLLAVGKI